MQVIQKRPSLGASIGAGIGRGLAEQVPKEIERGRLTSGLQKFEQESANLSPLQQLTRLSSIPGISPQMIQSFGELAKQQARGEALNKGRTPQASPFPEKVQSKETSKGLSPSLTTREPIEATLESYIPKTYDQLVDRAGEMFHSNPGLYNSDPQMALNAAIQEDAQNQSINQAQQTKRSNEQNVQGKVEEELKKQYAALGSVVPGNVYSQIEDKAINAVKPKSQGGEGLTEQQAKKKYGNELDKISREYDAIKGVGKGILISRTPSANKSQLKSIRTDFKKRNDLENLAKEFTSQNNLSPSKAYYLAYPSSDIKELNNQLTKVPELKSNFDIKKHALGQPQMNEDEIRSATLSIAPKLAEAMGKEGSPLSIAEEIKAKGFDPKIWLDYLDKNRDRLDLSERQGRELHLTRDFTPTLDDMWMFFFSGLDNLVEQ